MKTNILLSLLMAGCAATWHAPSDFTYTPISAGKYTLATYQHLSDTTSPIHIYIEGDGNSFNARGVPTSDPTPNGTFVRDMATRDKSPNVVYLARPCQYIMSPACTRSDWTDGRFSADIIDSMTHAIKHLAQNRPIVLIGYSGGAMVSGIIINQNPDMNIAHWITVAGVLNHSDWTAHFGDKPLTKSLNMTALPRVPQTHYIVSGDRVVPNHLSHKWAGAEKLIEITNATHDRIPELHLDFYSY